MELYIDDCIVYGETEEELVENLRNVFERFKMYNVTLNPKKCRFGCQSIEYVGHVIDKDGIRLTRSKIEEVLNFQMPVVLKDLASFIGLVIWFGDHLSHLAEELKPLREMEAEARKSKKLRWTEERRRCFYSVLRK